MQLVLNVLEIIGEVYITIVLLRFILQLTRADFYNPISQFVVTATNPLLIPLRKLIPGWKGFDIASLVLALLLHMILVCVVKLVPLGHIIPLLGQIFIVSLIGLLHLVIQFYTFAILILVIISWVAPGNYHPGSILLHQVTEPLLKPIRNIMPSAGGLDFSPMILLLLLYVIGSILSGNY
ncbi:YggT family protein [Hahella ganghwensis]|uniref:YggT family protein n=1 Tax=Hahella ganghwensis TaxID=286420 RepID=UPI00036E5C61|nr:YggT family protein [Hahella ganghwensis]